MGFFDLMLAPLNDQFMRFSVEKMKELASAIPQPTRMNRIEMNQRVDSDSLEFQIAAVRTRIEGTVGMLSTFDVSKIELSNDSNTLSYWTPTGHLNWANRHLLHEVVLLVADNRDVKGTIIVEGGCTRPVEEKDVIHAYQGPGKPALPMVRLHMEDPYKTRSARITRHTFGKDGIKIDPKNDLYIAFFPAGLGLA